MQVAQNLASKKVVPPPHRALGQSPKGTLGVSASTMMLGTETAGVVYGPQGSWGPTLVFPSSVGQKGLIIS